MKTQIKDIQIRLKRIAKLFKPLPSGGVGVGFLLVGVCFLLLSCEIDSYDKGEGRYSLLTAEMADVRTDASGYASTAVTDDGTQLTIEPRTSVRWMQKADTVYRALLYYNNVGDGKAKVVSISRVGVLYPSDSISTGMKTHPLHLESVWMSKNRKYLNLRLRLLVGSTDDDKAHQTIGLLADSISPGHRRLTLYHDQGDIPEYYSSTTYASIPLHAVGADTLTLVVNTYDNGVVSRTFAIR